MTKDVTSEVVPEGLAAHFVTQTFPGNLSRQICFHVSPVTDELRPFDAAPEFAKTPPLHASWFIHMTTLMLAETVN
jgi:hypothetical protein